MPLRPTPPRRRKPAKLKPPTSAPPAPPPAPPAPNPNPTTVDELNAEWSGAGPTAARCLARAPTLTVADGLAYLAAHCSRPDCHDGHHALVLEAFGGAPVLVWGRP